MICRRVWSMTSSLRVSERMFRQFVFAHEKESNNNAPEMINRFSADLHVVDSRLGEDLNSALGLSIELGVAMLAAIIVSPVLAGVAAMLLALYLWFAKRFLNTSWQLKQVESTAESAVLEHLTACQSGISSIRAFGKVDKSTSEFYSRLARQTKADWTLNLLNRWLDIRMNILGAIFSTLSVTFIAYSSSAVSASTAGFAISFAIEVSLLMASSVRSYSRLEYDMYSLACVDSLANLQQALPVEMEPFSCRSSFNSHRS